MGWVLTNGRAACKVVFWQSVIDQGGDMTETQQSEDIQPGESTQRAATLMVKKEWIKSSHSSYGNSLGVAPLSTGRVALAVTSNLEGPALVINREKWDAFVAGVKSGEFDYEKIFEGVTI